MEREIRIDQQYCNRWGAQNILDSFRGKYNDPEFSIVDHYDDGYRSITDTKGSKIWEKKDVIGKEIRAPNGLYKFVKSMETPITDISNLQSQKPRLTTYRLRYIINGLKVSGIPFDLHITFRTMIYSTRTESGVSIEAETSVDMPHLDQLNAIVDYIMGIHNGWHLSGDYPSQIINMNGQLKKMGLVAYKQVQKPVDITWKDITYKNLIEKPHAISTKADGVSYRLALTDSGIFFVDNSLHIMPLSNQKQGESILVEGELIGDVFYLYDALYLDGNLMNMHYDVRHSKLSKLKGRILSLKSKVLPTMRLEIKPILIPKTVSEFFDYMGRNTLPGVLEDGKILTPINEGYVCKPYKQKEPERLTIDFFIGMNGNGETKPYLFGDQGLEIADANVDWKITPKLGTIAEFKWDPRREVWYFYKDRQDKATPNSVWIYNIMVKLHRDPITKEVITGNTLSLMRKYHNRIKDDIYKWLHDSGAESITDIGSGKGGDLHRWVKYGFEVEAIEPDKQFVNGKNGLIERAQAMGAVYDKESSTLLGDGWSAQIFQEKVEDYIPEQKTDAVTLFNSATFLGPTILDEIILNTTVDGGLAVVMVLDGKLLEKEYLQSKSKKSDLVQISRTSCPTSGFDKYGRPSVGTDTFGNLGCISLTLRGSSTVDKEEAQIEGLVDVTVLEQMFSERGWSKVADELLNKEQLLGNDEKRYSSCQRVLLFHNKPQISSVTRLLYPSLGYGKEDVIDSPWGTLTRRGIISGDPISALLDILDPEYKDLSTIEKVIYSARYPSISDLLRMQQVYFIPEGSWDLLHIQKDGNILVWKALYATQDSNRKAGIVIMENNGKWYPVGRNGSWIW